MRNGYQPKAEGTTPPAPPTSGSNVHYPSIKKKLSCKHQYIFNFSEIINCGADKVYWFQCKKCNKYKAVSWGAKKLQKLKQSLIRDTKMNGKEN